MSAPLAPRWAICSEPRAPVGAGASWGLANRGAFVLSSCPFSASVVMNGGHMSGEQECIWDGRSDFQEGGFWQQVVLMAEGWQFPISRDSLCRGCAQSLVFDPELTWVTFKSSVRTFNNWTQRNFKRLIKKTCKWGKNPGSVLKLEIFCFFIIIFF